MMDHSIRTIPVIATDTTIAAISTPPGEGGIGIIRLSGPQAIPLAMIVFRRHDGAPLCSPESHRQYYGHIIDPCTAEVVDEVLCCVMRAPHSYTREDVVEISGHGGPQPLHSILQLLLTAGARLAQPGEFTQRAFLNGRLDLTQAEAVLDTIRARTDAGLRAVQRHLRGEVGTKVSALRQRLIALLASLEAAIDYAEEDITFLTPDEIRREITAVAAAVQALIASHRQGRLLREGAQTVIIGRPNTGKSSLLNALLGEARAIVTEIPGTTRDVIEEQWELGGIPLRLLDTAGIRETDDAVERIGVERSHASLALADLLLLVVDRSVPLTQEDRQLLTLVQGRPVIVVLNKADLPTGLRCEERAACRAMPVVALSAVTGDGMDTLKQAIRDLLLSGAAATESPALANARQRMAAEHAGDALAQALQTLEADGTEELLAVDLMAAATALGEITGEDIRSAVITDLFARFCVGK